MAEGFCRHFQSDVIEPYSAGIENHGLNLLAVKVMREIGIDISTQHSQTVDDLGIKVTRLYTNSQVGQEKSWEKYQFFGKKVALIVKKPRNI